MTKRKDYNCSFCDEVYNVGFGGGNNSHLCSSCKELHRDVYPGGISRKASDLLNDIKRNRNGRRAACHITLRDLLRCWPIDNICPVLKKPMVPRTRYAATVDRIDSSKPYTSDNVQIISYRANSMKCDADENDLKLFAKWVEETYE